MTSCSLKALSPNTVTLRVKALTYELGGGLEDGVGHDSAITPCSPRLTGNHPSSWVSLSWSLNSCPASLATNRSQKLCENRPILKQAKINPGCGDDGYLGELETRRSSDKGFWEGVSWSGCWLHGCVHIVKIHQPASWEHVYFFSVSVCSRYVVLCHKPPPDMVV